MIALESTTANPRILKEENQSSLRDKAQAFQSFSPSLRSPLGLKQSIRPTRKKRILVDCHAENNARNDKLLDSSDKPTPETTQSQIV